MEKKAIPHRCSVILTQTEEQAMKVYLMTDLEGVAGVMNSTDWIYRDSKYYERGKELLTEEVNAAIDGFFAAGADEVVVHDGHGPGAIDLMLLDPRARLQRGWRGTSNPLRGYPLQLEQDYDVLAFVGQHPKAGTEYGHLTHTGSFPVIDKQINGISVGEFGTIVFCGQLYGVVPIFASGCLALTKEAEELVPGIETVAVKEGVMSGSGDECTAEQYEKRNWGAIHLHPTKARALIRAGAEKALRRYMEAPDSFKPKRISPPYTHRVLFRPDKDNPEKREVYRESPDDLVSLL